MHIVSKMMHLTYLEPYGNLVNSNQRQLEMMNSEELFSETITEWFHEEHDDDSLLLAARNDCETSSQQTKTSTTTAIDMCTLAAADRAHAREIQSGNSDSTIENKGLRTAQSDCAI